MMQRFYFVRAKAVDESTFLDTKLRQVPASASRYSPSDESSHIRYFRETPLRSFNGANLNRGQLGMLRRVSDRYRDVNVSYSWGLVDCQKALKGNKGS